MSALECTAQEHSDESVLMKRCNLTVRLCHTTCRTYVADMTYDTLIKTQLCALAYLDILGLRKDRQQMLCHMLVDMQPAAVCGA